MQKETENLETQLDSNHDLVKELEKSLKDRFFHPVILSYLISWIICNWRFILFICFGSETMDEKISINRYGDFIHWYDWLLPFIGVTVYFIIPDTIKIFNYYIKKWFCIFNGLSKTKTEESIRFYTDLNKVYDARKEMIYSRFTTEELERITVENSELKLNVAQGESEINYLKGELGRLNQLISINSGVLTQGGGRC